jgi:pilus assembly protein Flp/PilA
MYQVAKSLVKRFASEKDGAALAEYGLLIGLIAVVSIAAIALLGTEIRDAFTAIQEAITAENLGG